MSKFQVMTGYPAGEIRYVFHCPGCECGHFVRTAGPSPIWQFNGDIDRPTVSPSILIRRPWGDPPKEQVCHSYVREGRIEFLNDCTHHLAGKSVEIPEFDL